MQTHFTVTGIVIHNDKEFEAAEDAIIREIREETGLKKDLKVLGLT